MVQGVSYQTEMKYAITKHFDWLTPFEEAENDQERKEILCLKYPKSCSLLETNAEFFSRMAVDVQRLELHRLLGFKTFEEFCTKKLGHTLDEVETIVTGVKILRDKGIEKPTVAEAIAAAYPLSSTGRPPKGTKLVPLSRGGNDRIVAKINRNHPDIAKRAKAGEFRSIHAAALAAGIAKPTFQCAKTVDAIVRGVHKHFTAADVRKIKEAL